MTTISQTDVTDLLVHWSEGDQEALNKLIPLVYDELHKLASRYLRRERRDHTLQTTAVVHEAYLKLVNQRDANFENRLHFFAVAAQIMRRILVDYARRHHASKRGGDLYKLSFDEALLTSEEKGADLLALDEALDRLAAIDPRQSRVVELRIFAGLTLEETAQALNISPSTVRREWSMAKAWLNRQIKNNDP
ncbi:MAG TPA: sigma-70 family RNA polymerase sigma factor [Blastocatellia bacterium]|nr:sigma-70 family RNA polymerase sigma factor [Blastocatellia bacterium]